MEKYWHYNLAIYTGSQGSINKWVVDIGQRRMSMQKIVLEAS